MDKLINYEDLGSFHENLVNDAVISEKTTWSSDKLSSEFIDVSTNIDNISTNIDNISTNLASKAEKSYVDTKLASKQDVLNASNNISISNNKISALGYTYNDYWNSFSIGKQGVTSKNTASGNNAFAEGSKTTASGNNSHSEGYNTKAAGNQSHAEGTETTASGFASHAEGYQNVTYNRGEHAEGYLNISHTYDAGYTDVSSFDKITIHSTGVGYEWTDGSDWFWQHQNGIEIMRNGDVYLYGVGGYDGVHIKNEDPSINVQTLQDVISSLEARIYALEHPTNS